VSASGFAPAPAHVTGEFMKVVLGADADGSNPGIEFLPWIVASTRAISRRIGAWGTMPNSADLIMQTQVDRRVTYREPYLFDPDLQNFTTNTVWTERPSRGGFPPACCAAYFYVEVTRTDAFNLAQCNLATRAEEPVLPRFQTQVKSLTRINVPEDQDDDVRCLIDPDASTYAVMCQAVMRSWIRLRGYELMPT
jgi:hypothetical protein